MSSSDGAPAGGRRRAGGPKGRRASPQARARLDELLGDAPARRDLLIEHLHRIQDAECCLPADLLAALAERMRLAQADVHEVATFYHHFDVVREGQARGPSLTVRVCESLPCAMAGGGELLGRLRATLGEAVRVQPVPCVGRCACAPVAIAGRRPVEHASETAVREALARGEHECPEPPLADEAGALARGHAQLRAIVGGGRSPADVVDVLDASGLRGLGGAGFPVARKWRAVAARPAPRLMVVNADEGEPGTFKDRFCLESDPHRVLEGALIAAWATGCDEIYLYLRDEYAGVRRRLERELARLAGDAFFAPLARVHLRRGAGAYVCGEESALIESIEGRRGMPRQRPPYVAERGLFGRPTLVNNVETLYWVPEILARGAHWFAGQGRRGRKGLRMFSVSGRVREPGVKLAPAGITLRELVDEHCGGMAPGHELHAYLPGGASGGILPASLADLPLDFDTLAPHGAFIGSAAVIVLSRHDDVHGAVRNLMGFFRGESCGQCTPCRVGTAKAAALLEQPVWDAGLLEALSATMADASICGLGQAAPNPVRTAIRYFGRTPGG